MCGHLLLSLSLKDSAIDVEDTMHLSPSDFQLQGSFLEAEAETSKPPQEVVQDLYGGKVFLVKPTIFGVSYGTNMN